MTSGPNRAKRGRGEEVSETFSFWERGDDSGAYLTISPKPGSHFIHGPIMWWNFFYKSCTWRSVRTSCPGGLLSCEVHTSRLLRIAKARKPDQVVLMIGGNDLGKRDFDLTHLSGELHLLGLDLAALGVEETWILPILPRRRTECGDVSPQTYEAMNRLLVFGTLQLRCSTWITRSALWHVTWCLCRREGSWPCTNDMLMVING